MLLVGGKTADLLIRVKVILAISTFLKLFNCLGACLGPTLKHFLAKLTTYVALEIFKALPLIQS